VIAEAIVTAKPALRGEDQNAIKFWRDQRFRATAKLVQATMRLIKVANNREVIRREWCTEDPVLHDLPNLRMQAGTNYRISSEHAQRLDALWSRTGRDWTRNEAVAGLWAYAETFGHQVSKGPGSPVSLVAMKVGRAASDVYAKVMNFRSLDPRSAGAGMLGVGEADRLVWLEFYDASTMALRLDALREEYLRILGHKCL
jgi:hypothetical protein